MSTDDIKKLDRKMFNLLKKYSSNHSHLIYRDEENRLCFQIRLNGGFDGITIEGYVTEDMFKNLEESLNEMMSEKMRQRFKQQDACVYSKAE